ncbi:MAG: hypothetical protein ACREL7_15165 [Longimicrobiales bacterium]
MRDVALSVGVACTLAAAMAACSEPESRSLFNEDPLGIEFAVVPGPCDLMKTLATDARDVFARDEESQARDLVKDMDTACQSGNQTAVTAQAWDLLRLVEFALGAGLVEGSPAQTAGFVGRLAACTTSLCQAAAVPVIDFGPAVSAFGLFDVHGTDSDDAIANGAVPFNDLAGNPNSALWGVEVDQPWSQATAANPVLVYGGPIFQGGLTLNELGLGDVQFSLDVFPDLGEFLDGAVHVGVCFSADVDLPPNANGLEGRMQREGVLLEEFVPGFCPATSSAQTASIIAPFAALARRLMPSSISARLFADTKVRVVGGTPLDFSLFAPVAALTIGSLHWVSPPPSVVISGQPLGNLEVQALSGAGTPMEKVSVELYLGGNQGVPAGAFLSGDVTSFTQERAGLLGIAQFPDGLAAAPSVNKPGGYTLCARGSLDGFTFTESCTTFNARNES